MNDIALTIVLVVLASALLFATGRSLWRKIRNRPRDRWGNVHTDQLK